MPLLLAIIALPLIEIALFVVIGGAIGLGPTLAFVLASFLLGGWVIRSQGERARNELRKAAAGAASGAPGVDPTGPLARGAASVLAGVLLMVPGFLTSALGLVLMIPAVPEMILRALASRVTVAGFGVSGTGYARPRPAEDDILEGEFHEVPSSQLPRRNGSGWTRD